jgi:hypothetical protein
MVNFSRKDFDGPDFNQAFKVVEVLVTKEIETTPSLAVEHLGEALGACWDSIRTMRRDFMYYYALHVKNRASKVSLAPLRDGLACADTAFPAQKKSLSK